MTRFAATGGSAPEALPPVAAKRLSLNQAGPPPRGRVPARGQVEVRVQERVLRLVEKEVVRIGGTRAGVGRIDQPRVDHALDHYLGAVVAAAIRAVWPADKIGAQRPP